MQLLNTLSMQLSQREQQSLGQLTGAALPLYISELVQQHPAVYLLIVQDTPAALRLEQELAVFLDTSRCPLLTLPDWETLPYDVFSPHQDIISQRLESLYQLPRLTQALVIVPVSTLLLRIAGREHLEQHSFLIREQQQTDLTALKQQLTAVGYRHVEQVMEHGEFSVRGSLLDLYPMGANTPYRIDFFDDEVEAIRTFDPDTQRS
jgi:transcription-repair coupling factor (superfamily II helicase)